VQTGKITGQGTPFDAVIGTVEDGIQHRAQVNLSLLAHRFQGGRGWMRSFSIAEVTVVEVGSSSESALRDFLGIAHLTLELLLHICLQTASYRNMTLLYTVHLLAVELFYKIVKVIGNMLCPTEAAVNLLY